MRKFLKNFANLAGFQFRKRDGVLFVIGMALPLILLFLVFLRLRHSGGLIHGDYLSLLLSGKRKLIYYFAVGFLEEFLFRGLLVGLLCRKIKNLSLNMLLSAAIFAIPHAINANIPILVLLLFSFAFGILACEMRCFSKSIWMSTAFHWTWNYTIVSVFMTTNTNQFIYAWITAEIVALAMVFYLLMKKEKKPLSIW